MKRRQWSRVRESHIDTQAQCQIVKAGTRTVSSVMTIQPSSHSNLNYSPLRVLYEAGENRTRPSTLECACDVTWGDALKRWLKPSHDA